MPQIPYVYIGKRILATIPILLGVTFLVIGAAEFIPGSRAERLSSKGALSQEQIAAIEKKYGWDKPFHERYLIYLKKVTLDGDWGQSSKTGQLVSDQLVKKIPATMELTIVAMILASFFGVIIGVVAALKPFSWIDYASMVGALTGISFPVFWLGIMLQLMIYPYSGRLPFELAATFEPVTNFYLIDTLFWGPEGSFIAALKHIALPAMALATIPLAVIARMTRASMMEVLTKDYVRTATAKGLARHIVIIKHALKNALIPIVTIAGLQLAALLGGAVLTESVFDWPGLGKYIVESAVAKDVVALQGAVLFVAVIFTLMNLLVDVSYGFIDPRIRVGKD